MAEFRKAVLTENGLALIQKTQISGIKLEFTGVATGAGVYEETEELSALSGLKDLRQRFDILSIDIKDERTVKLSVVISNEELREAYYVGEIGIYAADPDKGEILYSIAVAYPGKAEYLPAYNGSVPVYITLDTYQSVSDSENVTMQVDNTGYASAKDLKDLKEDVLNIHKTIDNVAIPSVTQLDITIPTSGWVTDTDTGGAYALSIDIAADGITEDLIPMLTILPGSTQVVKNCEMSTTVRTINGALRVYAQTVPTAEIQCSLALIDCGNAAEGEN